MMNSHLKTLILGIGNTVCGDDGAGIYVAERLKVNLDSCLVDVKETCFAGLGLLDLMAGYEKVIIVDSASIRGGNPGDIYRFTQDDLALNSSPYSSHEMGLGTILHLARETGIRLPKDIVIYVVKIHDRDDFFEGLTKKIKDSMSKMVELIRQEVNGCQMQWPVIRHQ